MHDVSLEFCKPGPGGAEDMLTAVATENYHDLERAAHTLKGSAGVLAAAEEVIHLAAEIEYDAPKCVYNFETILAECVNDFETTLA